MKVSSSWLKDYVQIDIEPSEMSDQLTMAGLEVDAVMPRFDYLDHVVVAKVVAVKKHPNADKLSLCQVDVAPDTRVQIVCGAPNVHEGMFTPCALPGAVLPGEFKIKKGKIRGEVSNGMLCSSTELRLDTDASGIMDLKGEFIAGTPLVEALELDDTVFEIDLTPNRPDCLSLIGVAREIAAFQVPAKNLSLPDFALPQDRICDKKIHDYAAVEILDPDLCPRYCAGMLFDVKIGPSPFWLQERLEAVGLTPINNVVDITNYVMMETGQPLHAFDFDTLEDSKIIVRRAGTDTEFTTLDSKVHKLEPDMLMICDGKRPVGVAGVMGGENSEITEKTTRVLVESAYFNPVSIRKTAKKTGIASDASHRFERGVDPEGTMNALNRAVALMAELADAQIAMEVIDERPQAVPQVTIDLSVAALNTRLGTCLDLEEISAILSSVAFDVQTISGDKLQVKVPSFRVDVSRPEDLSEEVARLWGYNNIETSYPMVRAEGRLLNPVISLREKIRQTLAGFSFLEAINYNFVSAESCDRLALGEDDARRQVETILNPISDQMSVLRSSLLPGLLETMKRNVSMQNNTLRLFEIGKVFFATQKGEQPIEKECIAGLMAGNRMEQSWYAKKTPYDFFDLKGVAEGLLDALLVEEISFAPVDPVIAPCFEPGYAAIVSAAGKEIGVMGKVAAAVLKNYGLKNEAFMFDFNLEQIQSAVPENIEARQLPKYPAITQDMTIIVDNSVSAGAVLAKMNSLNEKQALIENTFLFDAFEGQPLAEGKKSLSFRVVYRSPNKTLQEKNVRKIHAGLSASVIQHFNAALPE